MSPSAAKWKDYGGRGIKFLFTSFEQFLTELGRRPSPKHSLDRYPNNDGHYEPGNVRWATWQEQEKNKRLVVAEFQRGYALGFVAGVNSAQG